MSEPLEFFEAVVERFQLDGTCTLGVYRYHPQSVQEERVDHEVSCRELRAGYQRLLAATAAPMEIAINSRILTARGEVHVPLVDFVEPDLARVQPAGEELVAEFPASEAALFASGRSYHLYIGALLDAPDWVRFMGRILLLNPPRSADMVDARWVGHRLVAGYASLRWSALTPPYTALGPPRRVRYWPTPR